jgi:hypothetical protein
MFISWIRSTSPHTEKTQDWRTKLVVDYCKKKGRIVMIFGEFERNSTVAVFSPHCSSLHHLLSLHLSKQAIWLSK